MEGARKVLEGVAALVAERLPDLLSLRQTIEWKADGSPVTEADVLLERLIQGYLESVLEPLLFVGEETGGTCSDDADGWVAVLDPIDGTENFCSGLKEWGVSLSIWKNRAHAGSMLMLPELGERLLSGDAVEMYASRVTGFSSSLGPEVVAGLSEGGEARVMGCAVYNLFNVTTGRFKRFVNPVGAHAWDLLAGVMLALEHGCDVDVDGEPYDGRFLTPDRKYRVDVWNRHDHHPGEGSLSR